MGEVALSTQLQPNRDLMSSKAYSLGHRRAGTVSLNLSHSEDDSFLQQSKAYRNVSFLITTGTPPLEWELGSMLHILGVFLWGACLALLKGRWGALVSDVKHTRLCLRSTSTCESGLLWYSQSIWAMNTHKSSLRLPARDLHHHLLQGLALQTRWMEQTLFLVGFCRAWTLLVESQVGSQDMSCRSALLLYCLVQHLIHNPRKCDQQCLKEAVFEAYSR